MPISDRRRCNHRREDKDRQEQRHRWPAKRHGAVCEDRRKSHDRPPEFYSAGSDGTDPVSKPHDRRRSEEHTSELQSLMRNSYAVFCLKKTKTRTDNTSTTNTDNQQRQPIIIILP